MLKSEKMEEGKKKKRDEKGKVVEEVKKENCL